MIVSTMKKSKLTTEKELGFNSRKKRISSELSNPIQKESSPFVNEQIQEKVKEKAYSLFEKRGYSHGQDLNDWFQAEKIVSEELARSGKS